MPKMIRVFFAMIVFSGFCGSDWPQYRGPNRNDVSSETGLLKQWPEQGPPLLWTFETLGIGYSGVAVVQDRLYSIGARGDTEYLIALDISKVTNGTVAEIWSRPVGPLFDFNGNNWSAGPSSTPTIDRDLCFALGGNGDLICVRTGQGELVWSKNLPKELDAQVNPIGGGPKGLGWGFAWSPLVDGERLICVPGGPGGTVAALNKRTGEVVWRSTGVVDQAAYTSPMAAEIGGVRQYVVVTNQGVIGVAANDGAVLWNYRRKPPFGTEVVNSPIVHGALVYTTVGAGHGCELLRIGKVGDEFSVESVYSNKNMANHHGNVALIGEHVYGFSEGKGWMCQSFQSGEINWMERSKLRAGSMTSADGHIYCFSEDDGTVVLIESRAVGWHETGRFPLPRLSSSRKPSGRIWTPPVISGARLFLRDQEHLFCYDVRDAKANK